MRDCAVRCTGANVCADGQQCGRDGFCVDNAAVRCAAGGGVEDAGVGISLTDAHVDTPDAPPDAPTQGLLTLDVSGKGAIEIAGGATCSSSCQYSIKLDKAVTLEAHPGEDFRFEGWDGSLCPDDDSSTCTFAMPMSASVAARFRKD